MGIKELQNELLRTIAEMLVIEDTDTIAVVLKVNRKMTNTKNNFYLVGYKAKDTLTHFMQLKL